MVQASRIHGHEIHVVSYAYLDGDCLLYWSRLRGLYTDASFPWLVSASGVHQTRKRVVGAPNA